MCRVLLSFLCNLGGGALFAIFLLADVGGDSRRLAFGVTAGVAIIASIVCMTAYFKMV